MFGLLLRFYFVTLIFRYKYTYQKKIFRYKYTWLSLF